MPKLRQGKTNFTAGELDPRAYGRNDLKVWDNGARTLRNVFVHPLGGVMRRWGMRFVESLPSTARLISFEFNTEQVYLLVLLDQAIRVYRDGALMTTIVAPWTAAQVAQVYVTQSADTLLITHPDVQPRKITRTSHTAWTIAVWDWFTETDGTIRQPHYKFEADAVTLQASGTTGTVALTMSADYFRPSLDVGLRLRLGDKEMQVTAVADARHATAVVKQTLTTTEATRDWSEPAFSDRRGWPVSTCFHQARLVIGGSRDLPNRLWLSKSADLWNFDLGTGKDGEAIETPILSDQVNAIRGVFSGQHLQVFTSGAEWALFGEPLAPTKAEMKRQTRIGSPIDRMVAPVSVDGATVFAPRQGAGLKAFTYSDVTQLYQSDDLAVSAQHLLMRPVDVDYDPANRWMHVVDASGAVSTLTIYRSEQVTAWTRIETDGAVRSVAVTGDQVWLCVERSGAFSIERFDASCSTDAALTGTTTTAKTIWAGLDHLEGRSVRVIADGADAGSFVVTGGRITLPFAASTVEAGLPFAHVIEPLPPRFTDAPEEAAAKRWRPIGLTLLLHETKSLRLDTGSGVRSVPLRRLGEDLLDAPLPAWTGELSLRMSGWRATNDAPPWRIEDDTPVSFMLLAATLELSVNE